MMVTYYLDPDQQLTEEQIKRIEEAARRPITFDEDCPELTPEQLKKFRRVNPGLTPPRRD